MSETGLPRPFAPFNRAYTSVFQVDRLSLGLVVPIEAYPTQAVPQMNRHLERVQLAETLGFAAVWLRDVPFNVPSFGDAGQIFDPFVYLGALSCATREIALGVASIVLPLRHPAHVAKAAASVDQLSGGRLLLGVASGDRPEEFPALGLPYETRGARFREAMDYIQSMANPVPTPQNSHGTLQGGLDMLPKPHAGKLPLLVTGGSQQSPDWVAQNGAGWMTYPRDVASQGRVVSQYRQRLAAAEIPNKPVMQSLYIDLMAEDDAPPRPIHLGFQSGIGFLKTYLRSLQALGINHVALNLRFLRADIETTLRRISDEVLPEFHQQG